METLAAFLAGAAAKIYDDGVDMEMITDDYHKKILESLQCFLLGGLSIHNFTFSVVNLVINLLNHFANKNAFKEPYEFSLLAVYPLFLLLSFGTREYLTKADLMFFFILAATLFLEPMVVKEDKSPRKFVFRLGTFLVFLWFLFLDIKLSSGIYLTIVYAVGYLLLSTIYQGYHVSHMDINVFVDEVIKGIQAVFIADPDYDLQ